MKYQHLERFRVTLETVSPVFIGSAEKYSKKELILLPDDGIVLIPDLNRLISVLTEKGAQEAYEGYLLGKSDKTLRQFLQEQGIIVSPNAPWVQSRLRCSSNDIRNVNVLSCFIKNQQGKPYIPGASIKGAIRTALLAMKGTDRTFVSAKERALQKPDMRWSGDEEYPLRSLPLNTKKQTDAVNDLLRSLQVSDSAPFGDDALIVCKKLELTKDGRINGISNERGGGKSAPPLYRECLKPGLKTHFYVTIDTSLAKDQLSMELICNALKQWMKTQCEYDDRFYEPDAGLRGLQPKNVPIVLGGGVGFQSKSLLMKLKADRDQTIHSVLKYQFRKSYINRADDPAPYRMKLAQYNGGFYPMGRCSLTVEE